MTPGVQQDIDRITSIWRECRQKFGAAGNMLFGEFTIADAMYAPVVLRFITYCVELDAVSQNYAHSILALPAIQEWIEAARNELLVIGTDEIE
jgi:glutathione S-transferase